MHERVLELWGRPRGVPPAGGERGSVVSDMRSDAERGCIGVKATYAGNRLKGPVLQAPTRAANRMTASESTPRDGENVTEEQDSELTAAATVETFVEPQEADVRVNELGEGAVALDVRNRDISFRLILTNEEAEALLEELSAVANRPGE